MSVYKRGIKGFYYYNFMINGLRYIKSTKTTNKKIAEQIEAKAKLEVIKQNELGIKKKISFGAALKLVAEDYGTKPYVNSFPSMVKKINKLMDTKKQIHLLSNADLILLLSQLKKQKLKPKTIGHYFTTIRLANNKANELGYLINSDLKSPHKEPKANRIRIMSIEQENALLDRLNPSKYYNGKPITPGTAPIKYRSVLDNYHFCILLLDTGCRYMEVANLKWTDINFDDDEIKVWRNKTKNETVLIMTNRVKKALRERHKEKGKNKYVFIDKFGNARKYIPEGIRRALNLAGLEEFTIHDLRHCCASRLIRNGMSLYEVANILGHSNIKTTMKYAHLATSDISKKARDILNKDRKEIIHIDLNEESEKSIFPKNLSLIDSNIL